MTAPIRIVLADDQELLRATFRLLLDAAPGMEVVGEAGTGVETVAVVRQTVPDVVLMDIRMPELDGIGATAQITSDQALAGVRILVLTTFETDELVLAALRAGASGFLGKGVAPAALLDAIRTVATGESLLSPTATTALVKRFLASSTAHLDAALPGMNELTAREREITVLVARGLSNEEIADHLVISPATAKTHVNRAMTKVHAHDRAQLVVFAYEHGLMTPGTRTP
ncbi:response regulator transcription factor [Frankia sp. CNm7]|uniref:Response regulator transcription factor n=1 Tax=Frankia nepalensis TaxID=1836974 RepID=A0A937RH79_9ACTN|nr:response regulator transcription factor [Frankia nepalensis]MBL7498239.1 response regulator transcription factor [Frankia nepalensis]MBL7509535.1 response regulator transcription factor [Frankia nepalensis]MBL7517277.1 response regulator transcription factor [Frankia nepalensis]MBL7632166.1 response regulator transcription factor [Frankia nepalensis]